jgi:hypothetical protein
VTLDYLPGDVAHGAEIGITENSQDKDTSAFFAGGLEIENTGDVPITSVSFDASTTTLPDVEAVSASGIGSSHQVSGNTLTIGFDSLDPGETVVADANEFDFNHDTSAGTGAGPVDGEYHQAYEISGLEMTGTTVTVEYADGVTQTTTPFADGSPGGAVAVADDDVPAAPSIAVQGVSTDAGALGPPHEAATVPSATQTIDVDGPPDATVRLLRLEGQLNVDGPDGSFDIDPSYFDAPYETNRFYLDRSEQTVQLDGNGEAQATVTLTDNTDPATDNYAGVNYVVAVVEDGDGDTGLTSNVAVLKLDEDAGDEPSASDFDGDGVPNAEDPDDDNDGQPDTTDPFAIDPDDGTTTSTPVNLEFEPDSEPGTILGVGFTGLMTNGDGYQSLYDPADVTVDGAISYEVDDSDANDDTQERGFQVGVSPPTDQPWAVNTTVSGLPGPGSAQQYQLLGIQLGTGDQKNYVKLAAAAQGGGSVEFGKEEADDWETELTGDSSVLGPDTQVHLSIAVYPSTNTVEGFYRVEGGDWTSTGITYDVPGSWLDASDGSAPAVGLIGTSVGAPSFTGTWENLTVETLDAGSGQVNSLSGAAVAPGPTRPAVTDGGPARLAATSRTGVDPIVGAASGAGASR